MTVKSVSRRFAVACLLLALLATPPAHAFRCGSKLVREDMHEHQVRRACGEPTTVRHLGTAVRSVEMPTRRKLIPGASVERRGYYAQEVVITEYVYNFGPRRFMRRLLFEGGVLVSIEKIGYGYHE